MIMRQRDLLGAWLLLFIFGFVPLVASNHHRPRRRSSGTLAAFTFGRSPALVFGTSTSIFVGRSTSTVIPVFIALSSLFTRATPFGTINEPTRIGQHSEHERITRAAFGCPINVTVSDGACFEALSLTQLAGESGPVGHVGRGFNGGVGAPDTLDPVPEGPEAHCDNADFLDTKLFGLDQAYPQSRKQATRQLQTCVNHLRQRFGEGLDAADNIVDEYARIVEMQVDISVFYCRFSFPELHLHLFARGKCSAIEGFGRALHGIQDFYAHSNWADWPAEGPIGLGNPPGLGRDDPPTFLDLRAENEIDEQVPRNLSTGCFGGGLTDGPIGQPGHPLEPGSMDCTGRITHHTMNKDNGIIDPYTGTTNSPGPNTPRSEIDDNFERAVRAAIKDSQRQWRFFREEIRRVYGTERGNIIICSLVRDDPTHDCYGRRVAFVRDAGEETTGGNRIADMQIPIHRWLLAELEGNAHDEGSGEGPTSHNTTKRRGSSGSMREHIPLPLSGLEDIPLVNTGLEFGTALTELTRNSTAVPTNKTAIIAITHAHNPDLIDQIAHVFRAGDERIRVHIGLLPRAGSGPHRDTLIENPQEDDLITAVLRTGGTYSILHHDNDISSFLDHVISRGLTHYDNPSDTSTLLLPGLSISDYITPSSEPRRYAFEATAHDNILVSLSPISTSLKLKVLLRHVRSNSVVKELNVGRGGNASFVAELGFRDVPRGDAWYEVEVRHLGDGGFEGEPVEVGRLEGSGLFEVSVEVQDVGGIGDEDGDDEYESEEEGEVHREGDGTKGLKGESEGDAGKRRGDHEEL
ncbi:hypothetical protein FKW77_002163 [Venturia effusa]|uniref:Uncharacterized protein n=1 Tax=Venturia effusa TaxID=50376 RepID=A0A517L0V2_9PEZI|nr:hypothetical protein FKW77_002163 [Venturia effusa]